MINILARFFYCEWVYTENFDYWTTSCGETVYFLEGSLPHEEGMVFCHHCGRTIKIKE